ncbi:MULTISPECIES: hypothetical protein [Asticcacaulis]|uniref:hypothetical protein n=1 Tax=Asticcacaulis TaxID=76890 RepID=UPI001AE7331D|nr:MULTISPECIES: hypothetical protein [Asticcacaulis]MBP2159071.1 hypothetical protein [Asticcacaulis solisilvae]MDR6800116.1 hypothetical protein [Asticcacaulis sp. BE141]
MSWRRAFALGLAFICGGDVTKVGTSALSYSSPLRDPEVFSSDWLANWMEVRSFDPDSRSFVFELQLASLGRIAVPTRKAVLPGDARTEALVAMTAGADRDYLLKIARRESGMNPLARANLSSAAGLFQFTENTWLCMVLDAGPKLGVISAFGLVRTEDGRCRTPDRDDRTRLLALRYDPIVSTKLAGAFTSMNDAQFAGAFGRTPDDDERYILHVFGASNGTRLLQLAWSNPSLPAARFLPDAARANPAIFYDRYGRSRTVSQVVERLAL